MEFLHFFVVKKMIFAAH